jgi:hypothetical protein
MPFGRGFVSQMAFFSPKMMANVWTSNFQITGTKSLPNEEK